MTESPRTNLQALTSIQAAPRVAAAVDLRPQGQVYFAERMTALPTLAAVTEIVSWDIC